MSLLFQNLQHTFTAKNRKWLLTNVIGLSISFAVLLLIASYSLHELSYDKFHSKSKQIYRLTMEMGQGETKWHPARVPGRWPLNIPQEYSQVKNITRLVPFQKVKVKIGKKLFYSTKAYHCDTSFFQIFDFKLLSGSKSNLFKDSQDAVISKKIALTYFGSTDIIGKKISLIAQRAYQEDQFTIKGIMEDFPSNSHFHAEILCAPKKIENRNEWAFTYLLLEQNRSSDELVTSIQTKWDKEAKERKSVPKLHLQNIEEIHFHSKKQREMESNGNINNLFLLWGAALIVFLISFINFSNLNQVQFISQIKNLKVRKIIGANIFQINIQLIKKALLLFFISIFLGTFISLSFQKHLALFVFQSSYIYIYFGLVIIYFLLICIISILPAYGKRLNTNLNIMPKMGAQKFVSSLVIQIGMAIIIITCTILFQSQIHFLLDKHPGNREDCFLVLPNNTSHAIKNYESFKDEILKNPLVEEISTALEEPAGTITDNFEFKLEGFENTDKKTMNIFTCDTNFFTFFNIKALAGSLDFGNGTSYKWEQETFYLSNARKHEKTDLPKYKEVNEKHGTIHDKYVLNKSALRLLGISDPNQVIGKSFRFLFPTPDFFPEGEIIGVVDDFHYTNLYQEEKPLAIVSRKMFSSNFLIKINKDQKLKAIAAIQSCWKKINPETPFEYEFIEDTYQKVYANEYRLLDRIISFAFLAIVLSALGIFALSSYSIQHKTKEIGIRKANGASSIEIVSELLFEYTKWIGLAFVLACPIAYYIGKEWLSNFAYHIDIKWWYFTTSGFIAFVVCILTVSWQTWKASLQDPVVALKYE